jgi:hypothetical protein
MSVLITELIPEQGFEKVRDAIGSILKIELSNQKTLQELDEDITVWSERVSPMQTEEDLFFNILLGSINYGNFTQKDAQGRTLYFIDVYTCGKTKQSMTGAEDSGRRLHKYLGLVRYILASNKTKLLGLPFGTIGGTYVEDINMSEPTPSEDGQYTRFGRVSFAVRIHENQALWDGVDVLGANAVVKLDMTDMGYQYKFNNE